MSNHFNKAVAIVGVGAVMPDAPTLPKFWDNIKKGVYSISDVPENRWKKSLFYDEDRKAPDKAYSTIGGWVKEFEFDPIKWRLPIPPKVSDLMDLTQKYAITATREALLDFDFENKSFDRERTAVILGNAMGGDQHLYSAGRALFPEFADALNNAEGFRTLPANVRKEIIEAANAGLSPHFVPITEDTMPGELSNIAAGRIAALWDFRGMNYTTDAACASALAGISSAVNGLLAHDYDMVVTGGTDANMSPSTFIKFCKIGALSARDSRPYAEGADGFVMGEGCTIFIMKRLEDAERDGDKIYAVFRSIGGSSDGKGKGITAPNPKGQILAVKRAYERIGISPASVGLIEGHGTSTTVGDASELQSLTEVFKAFNLPVGSIALGSVKSNVGHLKGGAGSAGMMKAVMALYEKVLPPSLNFFAPNPNVDFNKVPFKVNTGLRPWDLNGQEVRRSGVSAFGFGGTNFHVVLEEYIPGRIRHDEKSTHFIADFPQPDQPVQHLKKPLRGAYVTGAANKTDLLSGLENDLTKVKGGWTPDREAPMLKDLRSNLRISIDFNTAEELAEKLIRCINALKADNKSSWKVLNAKGIFYGEGKPGKAAYLFTGQGSQYANMLRELKETEAIVKETFREADEIMTPLLGKPLSDYIFVDGSDKAKVAAAEHDLMQTEITQPAMLCADVALYRLMKEYGVDADMVIGHSLGEYGALVASGALDFKDALLAVSARGHQMAKVNVTDKGKMAAVFASPEQIEAILKQVNGYVVIANINSYGQSVIGGATDAVESAMKMAKAAGYHVSSLPVSHAFHTDIVAPASGPLREVLSDFNLKKPVIPIISNVTGDYYPVSNWNKEQMLDLLSRQVASPVQFVKGINNLYQNGARIFVEMGPKKALNGFVRDITENLEGVTNLFTNHPKTGEFESFNQALCGLYAAGLGNGRMEEIKMQPAATMESRPVPTPVVQVSNVNIPTTGTEIPSFDKESRYLELGKMFVDFLEKAENKIHPGTGGFEEKEIWITGASLGLPGVERVFSDENVERILRGDQFIRWIPDELQQKMVQKNITRLVKTGSNGPRFETIQSVDEVIKLAARRIDLDIVRDFDFPQDRMDALDAVSALAIGAGLDALRDAGIPMVMNYKTTSTGTQLPDRWLLPNDMRDDTGIIFASAFPGYDNFLDEIQRFKNDQAAKEKLALLENIRQKLVNLSGSAELTNQIDQQISALKSELESNPYVFNRRFLFRVLSMGHSQFAEYIGARGPNSSMNAACASLTQACGMANDWINAGRCNRVIVISADDITSDNMLPWYAAGFLATGAAATDARVEDAALPFDNRRHGMLIGMGGASLVIESKEIAQNRGITPIAQMMGSIFANSAFHGTRLDVSHIKFVMEKLIIDAEKRWNINRFDIAKQMVFVSHETYTPARGGSASAEIEALRYVFRDKANDIVIANTKGFTGHPMGVGIEDTIAIKILETGIVPPVANFSEVDPELGNLNLSKGGRYNVNYALRLAAGFGSQISIILYRWFPTKDQQRKSPTQLGFQYRITDEQKWKNWLRSVTGKTDPEIEVYKRTLRVSDPFVPVTNGKKEEIAAQPVIVPSKPVVPVVETPVSPVVSVSDPVKDRILQLVSEKTGYAADMLAVDLDLEADLGIDTVKQAELFADIRGLFNIPQDESIVLSEFSTLQHIIDFVYSKKPELAEQKVTLTQNATISTPVLSHETTVTTPATNEVTAKIMTLIAEKTGYPVEMLDLDLDLEADLGIDTVKQAELFSDIRGLFDIPQDDSIALSEFPTLNHILEFVYSKRPELRALASVAPVQTAAAPTPVFADKTAENVVPPSGQSQVVEDILNLIAQKTGYPPDMLDLDLDLEADLGIDTVKQAELFADIRGLFDIPQDDSIALSEFPTLNHILEFVYSKRPELRALASIAPVQTAATSAPVFADKTTENVVPASGKNQVVEDILNLIAQKTGYPPDMLDLDLDLEADLGIDTVKQAELFADIRGLFDIPQDDSIALSEFPTLNHILEFVYSKRPELRALASIAPVQTAATSAPVFADKTTENVVPASGKNQVVEDILNLIAQKTGYPPDMLDLDLDLEADLGIDTVKQAELFADIRGLFDIPQDDSIALSEFPTLNHILGFVYAKRPDLKPGLTPDAVTAAAKPVETLSYSPAASQTASGRDKIAQDIMQLISVKTGYPAEMLDLDLDLEADLGIDTVKQAELFAEIRGLYQIPADDSIELSNYPTLNHIIGFVMERKPGSADSIEGTTGQMVKPDAPTSSAIKAGDLDAVAQIPRRVPVPVLRPEAQLCKATGVELAGKRVIVKTDHGKTADALIKKLKALKAEILVISDHPGFDDLAVRIKEWVDNGGVHGVYWCAALDKEESLSTMSYETWKSATHSRIKLLYHTMRQLELTGQKDVFLVSATRLGGHFGYDETGAFAPLGGAVCGFTKAYKRENPASLVKVVDFGPAIKTTPFADVLIQETLFDNGVVELGYKKGLRWTISLEEKPQLTGNAGMALGKDTVYLITGAAGSIVSAITTDLAAANGGKFYLMDLTPEPDRNDPDIQLFENDKEGLKKKLFERLTQSGEKATPVKVEKMLAGIERKHAAFSAIRAIEQAGGTVHYFAVNLLDHEAVHAAVKEIMKNEQKLDVLLHAGGLEISKLLKDKGPDEFNLVFDVKADGWYNILSALGEFPVGAAVVFSSIAGRFGNGGQVDYSSANDFLCKSVSSFKNNRSATRGIALDWTAWGGIGMAVRGSIPMVMKQAGIDMLPPDAGIPFIRKELVASTETVEVVVAQSLGLMLKEFDQEGGIDPKKAAVLLKDHIMMGEIREMGLYGGLTVSVSLDPATQGFLFDHQINQVPVLPGVMGIETMAAVAGAFLPEMHVQAVQNISFLAPFKFYKSAPREVFVTVRFKESGDNILAQCELYGLRKLVGQDEAQKTTHFRAEVLLGKDPVTIPENIDKKLLKKAAKAVVLKAEDIYKVYFHGPAYQVIEEIRMKGEQMIGVFAENLPPNHTPENRSVFFMPRLIEHCFQTAGVHQLGVEGIMGLPASVRTFSAFRQWDGKKKLFALVDKTDAGYHAVISDDQGLIYLELDGYTTAELPTQMDAALLQPFSGLAGK